ncbi:hypothetical protein Tco_0760107, partial [Tanacetum coccineum]
MAHALVDVFGEELILRDGDEKLIFNVDNTSKHPRKHANESINMINFIDITCEDCFPEVLKKSNHPSSSSTTPLSNSLPSLTPFETNILLLEKLLNHDPSSPLPPKELHFEELKMIKSLIDDSPPLDVLGGNSVTFSNPLFDANDDFTSSDDESLLEEDVLKENFKIYSNPLFEFDEEYISSGINFLFNEVLKDIENKDSYVSHLDEPALLVTPLSDANVDECFDPGGDIDKINAFLDIDVSTDIEDGYHDSEGDVIYLKCSHNLPSEVFLDHNLKSLKDEPSIDDLKIKENVRITFEDHHYLSLIFFYQNLSTFSYLSCEFFFLFSSESEDTIFDPGISVFSFYSLESVVSHRSGTFILDPFVEIPSGESKVHIEVLSVLLGNRLPLLDGSLPLS